MTPQYGYAIAVGSDQSSLTNMEDIFLNVNIGVPIAPVGKPVPLGSARRRTLDRRVVTNGTKTVTWFIGAASRADFQRFIYMIFGDFDTENADVTIDTRMRDENFGRFNALAILPVDGVDYQRREHGDVEGLTLTFDVNSEVASAFTLGFSLGFEA